MKVTDPHVFKSGRHFGSWVGLTPKDHSTAGKTRLGGITRAGDEELRSLLVVGATAVIQQVRKSRGRQWPWLVELVKRKPPKLVAVALANKMAGSDVYNGVVVVAGAAGFQTRMSAWH